MPGRRATGEGSIVRYRGRWRVRVRWRGREQTWFRPTHVEAAAKLRSVLEQRAKGVSINGGRLPLSQWCEEWLAQSTLTAPRSQAFYAAKLAYILPQLGGISLDELEPAEIRRALAAVGTRHSPTTVQHVYRSLSTCLNAAVRERRITRNPAGDVQAPQRSGFVAQTLTVEQAQRLLEVSRDSWMGALIHLAIATGMRQGELFALTWDDLDLSERRLSVTKSLSRQKHAGPTKTAAGHRQLTLGASVVASLQHQRARVAQMRLEARDWKDRNLIFPTVTGGYRAPSGSFFREFRSFLTEAECPHIRFHDLRHTAGLFLTRSAGLVVASRILGHASPTITASLYGAAQRDDFLAAARSMDELLMTPSQSPPEVLQSPSLG